MSSSASLRPSSASLRPSQTTFSPSSTTPSPDSTTTTTAAPFFTADPSATPKDNTKNSSSLYLFTFLAALFLLLFVSSAIILRSFVLRRRFRRRIEEAILAGVITPNDVTSRGRGRNFGAKPKIWEAYVSPGGSEWDSIMPVAALTVSPPNNTPQAILPRPLHDDASLTDSSPPPLYRRVFRNPLRTRPSAEPPAETSPGSPRPELPQDAPPSAVQVSVLIAMPDARRSHMPGASSTSWKGKAKSVNSNWEYEEDELPEMVIGVSELQYRP
ncbi:hypothetical protein FA95DRAFT_1608564 [Auriscalpium vulgare]|uniref:Uncharacterized protein n=1 Tax=Auriscalpium vulgare TaxID=40419 RepID=A0ACB8RKK5_9AGAM|nr:hypothetical protein FA95DRAFT_1608564 [Auriscalpium vulgare]